MTPTPVIKSAEYIKSAVRPSQYPADEFPEVAFAGRSNVGKSSLINCLVQRRKLVRTSRIPGRTQTINFFLINGSFYFVDLPGYGYAKVPEQIRAQWGPMMESYLNERKTLKAIVHILDVRHPPTPEDLQLWNWLLNRDIPAIAVLTKADKIKKGQWEAHRKRAAISLGISADQTILFSAETQLGRQEVWSAIFSRMDLVS